jgi:Tol biopolymer transport system component
MGKTTQASVIMAICAIIFSFLLLFPGIAKVAEAEELYLGRRWAFSQLTATPVSHIAWSGDGKFLFFTLVGDEMSYIYRIKDVWKIRGGKTIPGNLRPEKIMEVRGKIQDFSFAPDRLAAAYSISEGAEYAGLYVANLATGQTMRIAQGRGPRWSPQGGKIAFYFFGKKRVFGIATINLDGSGLQVLSELNDWLPIWSPDGSSLAFLSARGFTAGSTGFSNIFVVRLNPLSTTKITQDSSAVQKNLAWGQKGRKIIFETYQGIEIVDTQSFQRKLVIPKTEYYVSHVFSPVFSPDGKWIIFRKETGMGLFQLYTQEEITVEGSIPWEHMALSPDGRKVSFSVSTGVKRGVWVVEAMEH